MRGASFVTSLQLPLPPVEELEGTLFLRHFIAEIISPAAVGVDVVEMLVEFFREEPGDDTEVFVMMSGKPARIPLRGFRRTPARRGFRGNIEFAWTKHPKRDSSLRTIIRSAKTRLRPADAQAGHERAKATA